MSNKFEKLAEKLAKFADADFECKSYPQAERNIIVLNKNGKKIKIDVIGSIEIDDM